jgi:hypothetical protein
VHSQLVGKVLGRAQRYLLLGDGERKLPLEQFLEQFYEARGEPGGGRVGGVQS